jgi:hypothetical protein
MKIAMPLVTLLSGAAVGSPLAPVSIKVQGTSIVQA